MRRVNERRSRLLEGAKELAHSLDRGVPCGVDRFEHLIKEGDHAREHREADCGGTSIGLV